MPVNWMDVSGLSFNTLLLLERVQLSWFPGWVPEKELAIALRANPVVEWYLRHKCPELNEWLDGLFPQVNKSQVFGPGEVRQAEETILKSINDLVVYVVDPEVYDTQGFLGWDTEELTSLIEFAGKTVIDVGSGTGRLAMVAAESAAAVYAVEPVANLRHYLKEKARAQGFNNLYPVDGLITDIPFADGFADVTMGGHVFGEYIEEEYREMVRVTKPGGIVALCPGNVDKDNEVHKFLVSEGFDWARFLEPEDDMKRKYWKKV